jgi:hypothetical protein
MIQQTLVVKRIAGGTHSRWDIKYIPLGSGSASSKAGSLAGSPSVIIKIFGLKILKFASLSIRN